MRSRAEIDAEIGKLASKAKYYDTDWHSDDACIAAGAHDALRWALGLAEDSVTEAITPALTARENQKQKCEPKP